MSTSPPITKPGCAKIRSAPLRPHRSDCDGPDEQLSAHQRASVQRKWQPASRKEIQVMSLMSNSPPTTFDLTKLSMKQGPVKGSIVHLGRPALVRSNLSGTGPPGRIGEDSARDAVLTSGYPTSPDVAKAKSESLRLSGITVRGITGTPPAEGDSCHRRSGPKGRST